MGGRGETSPQGKGIGDWIDCTTTRPEARGLGGFVLARPRICLNDNQYARIAPLRRPKVHYNVGHQLKLVVAKLRSKQPCFK